FLVKSLAEPFDLADADAAFGVNEPLRIPGPPARQVERIERLHQPSAVELGAPVHRGHQRDPETALDRRRLLQLTVEDDTRTRWRGIEADPGEPAGRHRIVGRQPLYPEQVLGPLDRVRLEERRRADRGEVLTEQEVRAKTLP